MRAHYRHFVFIIFLASPDVILKKTISMIIIQCRIHLRSNDHLSNAFIYEPCTEKHPKHPYDATATSRMDTLTLMNSGFSNFPAKCHRNDYIIITSGVVNPIIRPRQSTAK